MKKQELKIVENNNIVNIEIINTDNYLNKDGYYELDFSSDRKFDGEVFFFFYKKESFGNIHWYKMFDFYDKQNIKVICYTSFVFLPLMKNICHKAYLEKTPITKGFYDKEKPSKISVFDLDRNRFWHTYNVGQRGGYQSIQIANNAWMMSDEDAGHLGARHCKSTVLIDEKEYDNFIKQKHKFIPCQIVIESKRDSNQPFRDSFNKADRVHANHEFQRTILTTYTKFSYATYQILLSMYCGYGFIGIRGAASLLTMLPVNLLVASDIYNSNVLSSSINYHNQLNKYFYNLPTSGFNHHLDRERQIEGTWRELAINKIIDDYLNKKEYYVPTKKVTTINLSNNKKINKLLDNRNNLK